MKNKILINILIVFCLVCSFGTLSFAEGDALTPSISINNVEGSPGDEVELVLTGTNLPDQEMYLMNCWNIDRRFEIVSYELSHEDMAATIIKGTDYSWLEFGCVGSSFNPYVWNDGTLAKAIVKIPEDMPYGTYPINLDTISDDYYNVVGYSSSFQTIAATQIFGSITVKEAGSSTDDTAEYTATLDSSAISTVAPGSAFEVPVFIKSNSELAAAELNFNCTNAEITGIKEADLTISANSENVNCFVSSIEENKTKAKLTFCGNTASAKESLKVAILELKAGETGKAEVTFESGKATASGDTGVQQNMDGSYTILDGKDIETKTVSIDVTLPNYTVTIEEPYTPGFALIKCTPEGDMGAYVPAYDKKTMFKRTFTDNNSEKVEYLYLVSTSDLVKGQEDGSYAVGENKITLVTEAEAKDLSSELKGDLNGSKTVNIVDAQIAFDLSKGTGGKYKVIAEKLEAASVDMLHWLLGDVNTDNSVSAVDARAIMVYIHTQDWSKNLPA